MNVLIIEDEPIAVDKLTQLILRYDSGILIKAAIDSVEDSVQWLNENEHPDIVFMDIHLADGLSFEIFDHTEIRSPIIFTTAYDQYAISAFKTKSVDYLLKPIKFEDLKMAMTKFNEIFGRHKDVPDPDNTREVMDIIRAQNKIYKSRFLVRAGNMIKSIKIEDVAYFIFEDRNTMIVTFKGRKYPVKQTLDDLENLLNPLQFIRANRQFIVSIDSIDSIHPWFKGRLKLDLSPPQHAELVISSEKSKGFKEWLDR